MMVNEVNYKCRFCGKVYKTWDDMVKHKKITSHLGIDVLEK